MVSASLRAGITTDTIRSAGVPPCSASRGVGILPYFGVEGFERAHKPTPTEVSLRIMATVGGQAFAELAVAQNGQNAPGQCFGARCHQHRAIFREHGAVGRYVGGYYRPSRSEVIED